jgi:hypothetical protein
MQYQKVENSNFLSPDEMQLVFIDQQQQNDEVPFRIPVLTETSPDRFKSEMQIFSFCISGGSSETRGLSFRIFPRCSATGLHPQLLDKAGRYNASISAYYKRIQQIKQGTSIKDFGRV